MKKIPNPLDFLADKADEFEKNNYVTYIIAIAVILLLAALYVIFFK